MNLYPAILTDDVRQAQHQLEILKQVEEIETVHVDVIDGHFVDNMTVTPLDLVGLDFGHLTLSFHLMVQEPLDFVYELIECGSDLPVKTVIGQIEQMSYQDQFIAEVQKYNWQAGLCLNLHTPLESIEPESWDQVDSLLLLGVQAGYQGQKFNQKVFAKIEAFTQEYQRKSDPIELIVDGGVKLDHLDQLSEAGVDSAAVGSGIWKNKNPQGQLLKFLDQLG
ncbi:MAG: hypothetical protein GF381_02310 [Candidatus Pacebacteria bacterium]|nr:hypothetical protein [Candidatus Paceibacterota bacterium]